MVSIHPTAIVSPGAQLGADVVIGPFSVLEDNVRVGDGCTLAEHVVIRAHTTLGAHCRVDRGATLGGEAQHLRAQSRDGAVEIGDHNIIREFVTIHRASHDGGATRVGHHNFLMAFTHLGHDVTVGNHTSLANLVSVGGHAVIQDRAVLGGTVAVHQWATVGEMAMVGGMTGVNKDVPPFSLFEGVPGEVKGLNTVGLRRNGIDAETRATIKKALRLLYLSKRNRALALAEVERELPLCPELERLLAFVKATQHGRNGRQLEH